MGIVPSQVIIVGGGVSGRIVSDLLRSTRTRALSIVGGARPIRVSERHEEIDGGTCVSVTEDAEAVYVRLSDGRVLAGAAAVLATGCGSFGKPGDELCVSPKQMPHNHGVSSDAPLGIIGSGQTAADYALRCMESGHRGRIHMLSRTGYLPAARSASPILDLAPADIPLGTSLPYMVGWFRKTVEWSHSRGLDAQSVMNGLASHAGLIWQHLPPVDKRRFIAHVRPLWQAAGEYVAQEKHVIFLRAVADGQVLLVRGRHLHVKHTDNGYALTYMAPGVAAAETLRVGLVVNCEDAPPGHESFSMPMVADLISRGLARPDSLQFGLDVSENCALIDRKGRPSQRLFAIGAPTRGRFVDALEISRIRKQSERIARSILKQRKHQAA